MKPLIEEAVAALSWCYSTERRLQGSLQHDTMFMSMPKHALLVAATVMLVHPVSGGAPGPGHCHHNMFANKYAAYCENTICKEFRA